MGATDPVSVVATFWRLGAPRRLTTIMEGESLFNDGSAIVSFNLLLEVIVAQQFNAWNSLIEFMKASVGGLALGVAIGYLALGVLSRFNDYLTETLVTIIVAYATFLIGEEIGVSPALAVVAAGLMVGNMVQQKAMSPTTRVTVGLGWEFFGYVANSLIFLLVGEQVRSIDIAPFWGIALLAIVVTVVGRTVVIFFFGVESIERTAQICSLQVAANSSLGRIAWLFILSPSP